MAYVRMAGESPADANNDLDNACGLPKSYLRRSSSARVFVWTRSWTLIADTFHGQDSLIVAVIRDFQAEFMQTFMQR